MKPVRLIAMDMDGTLLNSQQQISKENANALLEAGRQGIRLAICSGRAPGDIALFALENHLEDCALLSLNGVYCLHSACEKKPFSQHVIAKDTLEDTIRILRSEAMPFACFAQNRIVLIDNEKYGYDFWVSHSDDPRAPQFLIGDEGLTQVLDDGVNKIICIAETQELIERARGRLERLNGLDVTSSWERNLELMPHGFGKGTAVEELANQLDLTSEEVMAIGDYDNDVGMIAYAAYGVAMANATECIRKAARFQTLSNDEHGVAWAIRRYALNGC